jgi:hypothetical protein
MDGLIHLFGQTSEVLKTLEVSLTIIHFFKEGDHVSCYKLLME